MPQGGTEMRAALAFLAAALAADALACGYCVEDRVAAVYDHAVVVKSLDRRHPVIFLAIEGALVPADGKAIESALRAVPGTDPGSLRVSVAGAAVSFSYDPKRGGLGPILGGMEGRLAAKGLGLSLLKVIDESEHPR